MKVLVTGGAGFIGSHIQDKLIELGHEVGILDNLRSGKKENLHPKSRFFEVDLRHRGSVKDVFEKFSPEAIFHLAAQNEVPYSMDHHYEDQETNIVGMMNLLEMAHDFGTKKVIYSNTGGALYGEVPDNHLPITEDEAILRPTSFYGVSKGCAEWYLKLYGNLYGLGWVSLRYSNVYGPRQAGNREAGIVANFTEKLLHQQIPTINGDGLHTRDYIYVGDVVSANMAALDYPQNNYFNISTGVETSNNTVFAAIESRLKTGLTPNHRPNRPGDPLRNSLSPAKAAKLLHWTPKISFADGIRQTLEYYAQHVN
jgi:UDP-glucose 4-epimerase